MQIPVSDEVWSQIKGALYAGNKISAIKIYRDATGQALKESKEAVELLESELRKAEPERFANKSAGCFARASLFLFGVGLLALFAR